MMIVCGDSYCHSSRNVKFVRLEIIATIIETVGHIICT